MPLEKNEHADDKTELPKEVLTEPAQIVSPFGIDLDFGGTGRALEVQKNEEEIKILVNPDKFETREAAEKAAILEASFLSHTQTALERDPKSFLQHKGKTGFLPSMRLASVGALRTGEPQIAQKIQQMPTNIGTLRQQFDAACVHYILTGRIPNDANEHINKALKALPKQGKNNPLDIIAANTKTLRANATMYEKYIKKAYQKVREMMAEQGLSEGDQYRPSTGLEENGLEENDALDESQIENKVEPFYGGYYRGRVYHYDPSALQIVEHPSAKHTFSVAAEERENKKRYTFTGVYTPGQETILPLPYKALPLPETLNPGADFQIMRDEQGVFSLSVTGQKTPREKVNFTFDFLLESAQENALSDAPKMEHLEKMGGNFDPQTQDFLQQLEQDSFLSPKQKAGRVITYVRKKFIYPEDSAAMNEMNEKYLAAGNGILSAICNHGITDCYWSNIFAGEMMKHLGIPHRIPIGFYIEKDPRFDFAALAGTGHAWSEVWMEDAWIRLDATPPKQNDEESEEENEEMENNEGDYRDPDEQEPQEENEEMENNEGDYGDPDEQEPQEELSLEEIEELFAELLELQEDEPENEDEDPEVFEGVLHSKWRTVENYIVRVNSLPVDRSSSISGKPSTLYQEWRDLFDLIYKRREIPQTQFRGPVRQSEGSELDDPVDAYIDVKTGEDDPMGYKVAHKKTRESVEVTEFEDDAILDLTGSMKQSGAYEDQKKMILANAYNIMGINRRLNLSYNKNKMREPLQVRSHIASFKGSSTKQLHHAREEEMNEQKLCHLYDALDNTETGMGNLVGSLQTYRQSISPELQTKLKTGQLKKVLTIISDGEIHNQSEVVTLVGELRQMGIIVQGIGFGDSAQSIRVVCHDPSDTDSAVVLTDVSQAAMARHKLLIKHLKSV